jgi:hypothetical protein
MGPTAVFSPQKKVVIRTFIALKNPSLSAGFEHANLGSNTNAITTTPLKNDLTD